MLFRKEDRPMAPHPTHYLKIDLSMPNPYGAALWLPRIEAATPFKDEADALTVKERVRDASGVIAGADGFFYVMKVSDMPLA
jgi:hypothetical protein